MFIYYPGSKFPSLSVTGPYCALKCKHCNGKYLQHMVPVETPEKLLEFVKKNKDRIEGFLLSGGSTREGKVPLKRYVSAVRWIVEHTDLKVNVHTGIIEEKDIEYLEEMAPHHISFDVIGSTDTVRRVLGIQRTREDYFHSLDLLDDSSLSYSPHIIAGLDFGRIVGEYEALKKVSSLKSFSNLVLIILIPTKGTEMEKVILDRKAIVDFFKEALREVPPERVVLGCMRPRDFHEVERVCIESRCRGIVLPSLRSIRLMESMGIDYERRELCCVL